MYNPVALEKTFMYFIIWWVAFSKFTRVRTQKCDCVDLCYIVSQPEGISHLFPSLSQDFYNEKTAGN